MEREQNNIPDGLAEIWRRAERRRAEDIAARFSQWFERRLRLKVFDARATDPTPKPNPGAIARA